MKKLLLICLIVCSSLLSFAQQPAADSIKVRAVISSFYKWYGRNSTKVNSFKLYSTTGKQPPFKINWKEVDRYLAWLHTNAPQLGLAFAANERSFFASCDSAFKTQQSGEVPYGFDSDRFTTSQEPAYTIEEINKARQWTIKITDETATVEVWGSYTDKGKEIETLVICFDMKKEKGRWTIAKIGCTFAAPPDQKIS